MRLAISNIAWEPQQDDKVATLLRSYEISAIDIAPSKYFSNFSLVTNQEIKKVKNYWNSRQIEIVGMQSLFFGTSELNIFGNADIQQKTLQHLTNVCRIASELGATKLVFGSPKNKDRLGLSLEDANEVASIFFIKLGEIAKSFGVYFCLEANPICYGANFMTNTEETALFVQKLSHSAIKLQLDTGTLMINQENVSELLDKYAHYIEHIHASEQNLVPLYSIKYHSQYARELLIKLPRKTVSIEMVATNNEPHLNSIERAIKFANEIYCNKK